MWRGSAGLIAAVLALAGCKHTDPKSADADKGKKATGGLASRPKGGGPAWLDDSLAKLPGAGTGVPKAGSWADPKGPGFDPTRESKGLLAGRVLDPLGNPAKNVFIRIDPVDARPAEKDGGAVGILTDANGYFMAKALAPGRAYTLTAEAKLDNKPLVGVVQTRPPQPNIAIQLRDDFTLPAGGSNPAPATGLPPGVPTTQLPFPAPSGDHIPPMGLPGPAPVSAPTRPSDGGWAPGTGAASGSIPPTLPGPTGVAPAPAATPVPTITDPKPAPAPNPERTAEGPQPWKPPAVSIPGSPPVPSLPLPPPRPPAPPAGPTPEKRSARPVKAGANFALVDTLDRPWDFATHRSPLVLLDFMTTTCIPCKRAVPILADLQARYGASGLQLVGVVCDDAPQRERAALAAKYQREHNLNYALYVEPGPEPGEVRDRFQVESYPTVILLTGEGKVVWRGNPWYKAELESAIRRHLGR
jgi:thiol-disulfide isomerase/thioredoxin